MLLSEAIKKLADLIAEHGDIELRVWKWSYHDEFLKDVDDLKFVEKDRDEPEHVAVRAEGYKR